MKLELLKAHVKDITWGDKTELTKDGTLLVNKKELLETIADADNFKTADADMTRPGEKVRIVPVKDVIEPRCKTEGTGEVFPGMISDVEPVGSGKNFCAGGRGGSNMRTYSRVPGRHYRYVRQWGRLYPILKNAEPRPHL